GQVCQALGAVGGQVVAEFLHGGDGLRVDDATGAGAGAVRVDSPVAAQAGKGLGHLLRLEFSMQTKTTRRGEKGWGRSTAASCRLGFRAARPAPAHGETRTREPRTK